MARKGEHPDRWAEPGGPPAERAARPGDGTGWIEPGLHGWGEPRRDPFGRRRPLGPKNYTRPDERIRDEVCERIGRSGIDAREVEVAVAAGEVTLTGTVLSRDDKRALEDLVDDVFGVEDVHNRLRIVRGREPRPERGRVELTGVHRTARGAPGPRRRGGRSRGGDPGGTH